MIEPQPLQRLPDWRVRLTDYLNRVARLRFRPGRHDCALFAAGAVQAMTGIDPARGWRGYRTLNEGRLKLERLGYGDHIALAEAWLPEVPPSFGREGDIAVLDGDIDQSLGVVQGARIYVLRPGGLGLVSLTEAQRMFRV